MHLIEFHLYQLLDTDFVINITKMLAFLHGIWLYS